MNERFSNRENDRSGLEIKSANNVRLEAGLSGPVDIVDQTFQQSMLITAKGGSISFAGRIFEYIIRFIFSILVARVIGAEQYGLYVLGLAIIPVLSTMALLGLQTGVVAFLAPAIRQKDEARIWGIVQISFGIPFLLSVLFGVGLFILAEPLAALGFHDLRLVPLLRIVGVSIPLDAVGFIAYQVMISYKKPLYSVIANNIVLPVAKLLLTIVFLALGMGVMGVVLAHVIASALGLGLILFFVQALLPAGNSFLAARRNTGELLLYSLPVHLGWVLNTVRGSVETFVLGIVGLPAGVGIFAVAYKLSSMGTLLFLSVGNITTPLIADFFSRGEMSQLRDIYQITTKWVVMFNIPVFLTYIFFAKPLLSIFGADFTSGTTALIVLAVGNLVYTGTGIGANILDMTNHTKINSANSMLMVVITLASDLLFIPRWGVLGAAAASALSTVLVNLICLLEVYVLLKMQPYTLDIVKPLAAGAVTAVLIYILNLYLVLPPLLHLFVGAGVLWIAYTLTLTCLGLSENDRLVLSNVRTRIKSLLPVRRLEVRQSK